jgi:hypothetical protein
MIIKDYSGYAIHIHFAPYEFQCPYCKNMIDDSDSKYLKRTQKNISMVTKVKCKCGNKFNLAVDMTGKYQSFK